MFATQLVGLGLMAAGVPPESALESANAVVPVAEAAPAAAPAPVVAPASAQPAPAQPAAADTTPIDDPWLPIHYPTVNLSTFLDRGEEWIGVSHAYSADPEDFLKVGAGIGEAIRASDKRVVLIASGSMSHRFWPLRLIPAHEASDPIHISTPEAREADLERIAWFQEGNHAAVIDSMPQYLRHAPEARFGHYLMMAAALGGREWTAKGRLFSDYENATGTSQVHVWFDRPEGGW